MGKEPTSAPSRLSSINQKLSLCLLLNINPFALWKLSSWIVISINDCVSLDEQVYYHYIIFQVLSLPTR